jgi:hypothetical protein
LVLANHGYWFGGQTNEITATWAVEADLPAAVLDWELAFDRVRITKGSLDIFGNAKATTIKLAMPEVRAATCLNWNYTLRRKDSSDVIQTGSLPIVLYPKNLFADFSMQFKNRKLTLVDPKPELSAFLSRRNIPNTRLSDIWRLQTVQADLLIVADGALGRLTIAESCLVSQAQHGANVAVLKQRGDMLVGYRLVACLPGPLAYCDRHSLLTNLDCMAGKALCRSDPPAFAVALPDAEKTVKIVSFTREPVGTDPVTSDALLLSETLGRGRIVLCQISVASPERDPLSQIFYNNLLQYLLTRPEPMTDAVEKGSVVKVAEPTTDLIPSFGAKP